jgi:hypothetical protein
MRIFIYLFIFAQPFFLRKKVATKKPKSLPKNYLNFFFMYKIGSMKNVMAAVEFVLILIEGWNSE